MSATDNALAGAKAAMQKASELTNSVNKTAPPVKAKPAPVAAAPVAPKQKTAGEDIAAGLKAKSDAIKEYNDATPKYHKGGKIEKDGKQVINAEKGETVLPNHDSERAKELAVKHLEGMADAMKKDEKDSKHKHKGRKKGRVTDSHVKHHPNGSKTVKHIHDMSHPDNEGMPSMSGDDETVHAVENMDGVHDSLEEHAGEPNPGEPEADAGQHGVPSDMAQKAGLPMPAQGA
jgi:hypothetical protein